jgi:hypothetical protein
MFPKYFTMSYLVYTLKLICTLEKMIINSKYEFSPELTKILNVKRCTIGALPIVLEFHVIKVLPAFQQILTKIKYNEKLLALNSFH